jgi:hypothetical protein
VAAEERQKKQARVIHARKRWRRRERVKPTRRSIHRRVGVCAVSDEGVLGGYLTGVTVSVRWTGNLPDRADVVAFGGAGVARGKMATTWSRTWRSVEVLIRLCSMDLDSSGPNLLIGAITEAIGS